MFRQILSTLRRSTIFKRIPFERDAGFHDAALTLGFSEDTAHKIDNVASGMFGDLRWTNSCDGDNYFINNLLNMQALSVNLEDIPMTGDVTETCRDHDFLYRVLLNSAPGEYGFVKALNLATMACIEPSVPCALVASVRNEGPFLIEWLAHNRALGIKDIYIYTNDNTDGSTELLKRLAEHGVIKLILNESSLTVNPQVKAYEHSLLLLPELRKFEWVLYLDADEFFIPAAKYDFRIGPLILDVKERFSTSLPACICYNWYWVGSGGAIRRDKGRVTERFSYGGRGSNFVKSLVRPASVLSMRGVHKPSLVPSGFGVNSSFEEVSMEGHGLSYDFSGGQINHYWNKSFQEFLVKQSRGIDRPIWQRETELFFDWDIASGKDSFSPFPENLVHRLRVEQAFLLSLPDISQIVGRVEALYEAICHEICHLDNLEMAYLNAKNCTRIINCLKQSLSGQITTDPEKSERLSELLAVVRASQ